RRTRLGGEERFPVADHGAIIRTGGRESWLQRSSVLVVPGAATDAALGGDDRVAVRPLVGLPAMPLAQAPQPVPQVANAVRGSVVHGGRLPRSCRASRACCRPNRRTAQVLRMARRSPRGGAGAQ